MNKLRVPTVAILAAIIIVAISIPIVRATDGISYFNNYYNPGGKSYSYVPGGESYSYVPGGASQLFIPNECSVREVKTVTQLDNNFRASDILRFEVDSEGNVNQVINLTDDAQLDGHRPSGGASSWGSTDPTGCWHVFQHQIGNSTDLWVVSTSGPPDGLWRITFTGSAVHPNWNQRTGEIIFTDTSDGHLYITDMFMNIHQKLEQVGDKARFSPDGKRLIFNRRLLTYLLDEKDVRHFLGTGDHGIWSPDGMKIYLINSPQITVIDASGGNAFYYPAADHIAPDPRNNPIFDILERNGQLVLLGNEGAMVEVSGKAAEWNLDAQHIEPAWWMWPYE